MNKNADTKLKELLEAVRQNPNDAKAHARLGAVYGHHDRWQEAIPEFKKAIHLKPDYAEAHYNLGVAYNQIGDGVNAIVHMAKAVRLFEKSGDPSLLANARKTLRELYAKYGFKPEDFAPSGSKP